jgi:hypothetical protein
LGWSCFGASDHGPVSFRRVGQSVDLPGKARRWGHELRGSPQSGCLTACSLTARAVGQFLRRELRWHLESYAEPGPDGLIFVGEKGAPFRRSTFGRKWRRAREIVGMHEGFRFYDLRHRGHTLSTRSGATLKDRWCAPGSPPRRPH